MKRAALYLRHSIADLNPETQCKELRQFAAGQGYEVVVDYVDHGVNGARVRRPDLDRMLKDAAQDKFDVVFVLSCDRLARDAKHLLHVVEELNGLGIRFMSLHEGIDTDGPVGAAIVLVISALNGLDRASKVERIRAGMRRAQMEGRRIGRAPLDVDHAGLIRDRLAGMSLSAVARKYGLSRSSVVRFVREALGRHTGAIT
jgi:DNA invertase Pin-like site-specific DNA recombinase